MIIDNNLGIINDTRKEIVLVGGTLEAQLFHKELENKALKAGASF